RLLRLVHGFAPRSAQGSAVALQRQRLRGQRESVCCEAGLTMDDAELVRQFENLTLPFSQWTHRAHVKVAYTYLKRHCFDEALTKMRAGVKTYNGHNKVPESPTSGYNETTTHAFLHLSAATMRAYGEPFATPDADRFCDTHPQMMTRHSLRLFYSPQRRMDPRAKTEFIEP